MQREQTLEDNHVETPHFDDEQTLLSAQPVVPLNKIRRNLPSRRQWFLGGALLVAVGLGAGAALLLVHLRRPAMVQSTAVVPSSQSESGDNDASVASAHDNSGNKTDESDETANINEDQKATHKHSARVRPKISPSVQVQNTDDDNNAPVLVDQWQERRSRRVTRMDKRNGNHHQRDLFRIRDIFEGERP
ncbi:MAG: hypothetical protein C5B55_03575 [Blastocatellia bacterium]|nr:MAG: hypothetical protein C5B55_03575 [Blastocatellia bacterium]